jgi:hypothetical protein
MIAIRRLFFPQRAAFKEAVKERNKNRPSKKRKNTVDPQVAVPRNAKQHLLQQQQQQQKQLDSEGGLDVDADGGMAGGLEAGPGGVLGVAGADPDDLPPDAAGLDVLGGPGDDDGLGGLGIGIGLGLGDSDAGGLGDPSDVGVEVEDMLVDAPP